MSNFTELLSLRLKDESRSNLRELELGRVLGATPRLALDTIGIGTSHAVKTAPCCNGLTLTKRETLCASSSIYHFDFRKVPPSVLTFCAATMPKRKETEGGRPAPGVEQDFPRGGAGPLSSVEVLQARQEAEDEVRGGIIVPAAKKQKKEKGAGKKRGISGEEADGEAELLQGGVKGKLPKFVELLKFKVS